MKEIFVLVLVLVIVIVIVIVIERTLSITSTSTIRCGGLSTSTIKSAHRCVGCRSVLWSRDHILALIAEDLEGFVEVSAKEPRRIFRPKKRVNLQVGNFF
jgi:hypothetical protein